MAQNNGESADIPELVQTTEAQFQTELTASTIRQRPTLGAVIDYYGRTLGILAWFVNPATGDMFANVDDGTITTDPSGRGDATVRVQDPTTGDIRTYTMPDVATAFFTLKLRTQHCNGLNG